MKNTVEKIDLAIRDLYRIDVPFLARDFLTNPYRSDAPNLPNGTLFVKEESGDLSIGIFIHPDLHRPLSACEQKAKIAWTPSETNAFATTAEEISHFLYLIFNATQGRKVSQLELELQGEIDKFLVLFFADQATPETEKFGKVFDTVFQNFSWHPHISGKERSRYEEANAFAKRFISSLRDPLCNKASHPKLFGLLRNYYRLSSSERMGYLTKT